MLSGSDTFCAVYFFLFSTANHRFFFGQIQPLSFEVLKVGCIFIIVYMWAVFVVFLFHHHHSLVDSLHKCLLTDPSIPAAKLEVIVSTGIRFSWHPIFLLLSSYRSYMASFNCLEKKSTDSQIEITGVICTPSSQCV